MSKKYYAVTTEMVFQKTVLVPADVVNSFKEAADYVDSLVETGKIILLNEEAECDTRAYSHSDINGMVDDDEAKYMDIV